MFNLPFFGFDVQPQESDWRSLYNTLVAVLGGREAFRRFWGMARVYADPCPTDDDYYGWRLGHVVGVTCEGGVGYAEAARRLAEPVA